MTDFKVGDVVVKVKGRIVPGQHKCAPHVRRIPNGAILRIDEVISGPWQDLALFFASYPSDHSSRGWHESCFRHLPKADEKFTAKIRTCKPIKQNA